MGVLLIIVVIIFGYFILFRKKHTQETPVRTFPEGDIDKEVFQFADAFLLLSNQYPESCRFSLSACRAYMHFYDYKCSTFFRTFIDNDNNSLYMHWADFLNGNHWQEFAYLGVPLCTDCGWVLRNYGHEVGSSWDCEINRPVSQATAEKIYQLLSSSSRLSVKKGSAFVSAEYDADA